MNKKNAHLYLPLVQALADGKTIQTEFGGYWYDEDEISFYDDPEDYRIKPEPRTFEMWLTPEGSLYHLNITPFSSWKAITLQEVLK